MDFAAAPRVRSIAVALEEFMRERVYPAESVFAAQLAAAGDPHADVPVLSELAIEARRRGLWNLFWPRPSEWGPGLSHLEYAPLAELTGRSPLGPAAVNCQAPDTGNMEILAAFGTAEQRELWLDPLLAGTIASVFAMTEPGVASSDATNVATRITADGDEYVIDGTKWWISGAARARARLAIVMGVTDPDADPHHRQSLVLVPLDAPGVTVVRDLEIFGYDDHEGHCELRFDGVRVPRSSLLGDEGQGFVVAQARLGPGRIHHCMRAVGAAERALELMCRRAHARVAFGEPLHRRGVVREWVADSRLEIDQARLLTQRAAWLMDHGEERDVRSQIAAIKIAVPAMACRVIDRAIQLHGAAGLSQDTPLAWMYAWQRGLRIVDGPDEVHRRTLGRLELARWAPAPA